jgi:hypothetical protein
MINKTDIYKAFDTIISDIEKIENNKKIINHFKL